MKKMIYILIILVVVSVTVALVFGKPHKYIVQGKYGESFTVRPTMLFGLASPVLPSYSAIDFPDFRIAYKGKRMPETGGGSGSWQYEIFDVITQDGEHLTTTSIALDRIPNAKRTFSAGGNKFILQHSLESFPLANKKFIINQDTQVLERN